MNKIFNILIMLFLLNSCVSPEKDVGVNTPFYPLYLNQNETYNYTVVIDNKTIEPLGSNNSLIYLGEKSYQITDTTSKYLQRIKMPVITNSIFQKDTAVIKLWSFENNKLYEYGIQKIDGNYLLDDPYYTKIFVNPLLLIDYNLPDNLDLGNNYNHHPQMYTEQILITQNNQEITTIKLHHYFLIPQYWNNYYNGEIDIYFTADAIVRIDGEIDGNSISLNLQ